MIALRFRLCCLASIIVLPICKAGTIPHASRAERVVVIQKDGAFNDAFATSTVSSHAWLELETNYTHDLIFFTTIDIGSPPRPFRVLVDISTPDTFVSSIDCKNCFPGDNRYDAALSSTSKVGSEKLEIDNYWFRASGIPVNDTMNLGGLSVQGQSFIAASQAGPIGSAWDDISQVHGWLGLSPSSIGSVLKSSSPFVKMIEQGVLEKNVMTLRLRHPQRLTFGIINEILFTGSIKYVPLVQDLNDGRFTDSWQTPISYLTLGSEPGVRFDLSGLTASFSTTSAFIIVPTSIAFVIVQSLDFELIPFMPPAVPCDRRQYLPDITFNLSGSNFTLTPWDYTLEWPMEGRGRMCACAITPSGYASGEDREVVLGNAFLRKFYSVWDYDGRIGFAELSNI